MLNNPMMKNGLVKWYRIFAITMQKNILIYEEDFLLW